MGACASKPKVLGDKLRDKPQHAPSRSASKSNGGVPSSPSMKKVTSMNEGKHISSDSAISNQNSMYSSPRVEDGKKYGDMREVNMTRREDNDDGTKYDDKDEHDDENDEGGEEDENDQERSVTSEENEDDENGDEFEDEKVTTMRQKDGHDDDEVRDEDKSEDNDCNKKETILNRSMNECVDEDEGEEEDKDRHEIVITQTDDETNEEDVGEKQVLLMQRKNKYEDVDLRSSVCDQKNQMDDISPRKLHGSPSSKNRDNDQVNHDHNVNINLHSKDVVDPVEEAQNIFMGDVNKLELHDKPTTKQRESEYPEIKSTSSNEEVEEEPINPKSPPPTHDNKSVVIEAANPTGLQTLLSSSPAKPTKDVVVLDQHPTLHPTMVLKDPPPNLVNKDVAAKKAEVKPKENDDDDDDDDDRCTNIAISSTIAF